MYSSEQTTEKKSACVTAKTNANLHAHALSVVRVITPLETHLLSKQLAEANIQSTLVFSKSKGFFEMLRDIRTSIYQI